MTDDGTTGTRVPVERAPSGAVEAPAAAVPDVAADQPDGNSAAGNWATGNGSVGAGDVDEREIHLFLLAGRLLLEHSEATPKVEQTLYALAAHLGREIRIGIGYRDLTLFLRCGDHFEGRVSRFTPELKIDMRTITLVHDALRRLGRRRADLDETILTLERLAGAPPQVNRWLAAGMLGIAAASLAGSFGGDEGCALGSALAAALGVLLRRELARRRFNLFFLPFAAALLGALVGGTVVRAGWTTTPELCLLVPSLVLVPGVHLLNAAYDLFENHMPIALARAALSASILGAIAFGLLLGAAATGSLLPVSVEAVGIPLPAAILFGAAASCGFGVFFDVPARLLWVCVGCGVAAQVGRVVGVGFGLDPAWSVLLASAVVGVLAAAVRQRFDAPFAAIAFGAVVPLVPGALILRAASGTAQLVAAGPASAPAILVETAVAGLRALLMLLAIAVGLLAPVALVRRAPRTRPDAMPEL